VKLKISDQIVAVSLSHQWLLVKSIHGCSLLAKFLFLPKWGSIYGLIGQWLSANPFIKLKISDQIVVLRLTWVLNSSIHKSMIFGASNLAATLLQ